MKEYRKIQNDVFQEFYACSDGHIYKKIDDKYEQLKEHIHPDGYYDIAYPFYAKGSNYVHRVIAITFLGYPEGYKPHMWVVDHKNNDHLDNRLCNLEWVTQSENLRRARMLRKSPKRQRRVRCIETGEVFNSISEASKKLNIRYYSIYGALERNGSIHGYTFEEV